jgi:hypothetical protein
LSAEAAIQILLFSGLIPAATAFGLCLAAGWLLPTDTARRLSVPAAFALAVFIAFAVSPTTKALTPEQSWDWIPYLGLLAALVSGLSYAAGITRGERWIAIIATAALAAWLIVPTWEALVETRMSLVYGLAAGIAVLAVLLSPLASDTSPSPIRFFPLWLVCAASAATLFILAEVSELFGRLAALPASALTGCAIASWLSPRPCDWRSIGLPFAVVVGGYAFTGYIYPTEPLTPLLIVPFAPLALWLCLKGPLARLKGRAAFLVQAVCVLTPIIAAVAWLYSRSAGDEW